MASTVNKGFRDLGLSALHGTPLGLHMEDNLHKKAARRILKRDYQLEHNHATVIIRRAIRRCEQPYKKIIEGHKT